MRQYTQDGQLIKVICNSCGRNLLVENGILKEDILEGKKTFGYFSQKDGVEERFDLCETCYEEITKGFAVPVEQSEQLEFL